MGWQIVARAQSAMPAPDKALNDLRSTSLAKRQLMNYEQQAVLKLQDALDYITIVGSHKYNKTMRSTALKSVVDKFVVDAQGACEWLRIKESTAPKTLRKKEKKSTCLIADKLQELLDNAPYDLQLNYTELRIEKALKRQLDGSYNGQLSYIQAIKTKNKVGDQHQQLAERIPVDFVLKRVKKQFGSTIEEVWEVFFVEVL